LHCTTLAADWPFEDHSLDVTGRITTSNTCATTCSDVQGLFDHVRWPDTPALETLLTFLQKHT
jgi:hypothetical protein